MKKLLRTQFAMSSIQLLPPSSRRNAVCRRSFFFLPVSFLYQPYGSVMGALITSASGGMSFSKPSSTAISSGLSGVYTTGRQPNCGRYLVNFNHRYTPTPALGGQ